MDTSTARAPRARLIPIERQAAEYLTLKREADLIKKRMDAVKADIMDALAQSGEVDEKGSQYYKLTKPIESGGKTFTTLKRECVRTQYVDEIVAEEILSEKNLYEQCLVYVPELDHDKVYALYQDEELTEDDIDKIFTYKESYRLQTLVS